MNGNGYGAGESGERDDAASEPLPTRRPAQGRHTFSPLRFDSEAEPYPAYGSSDGGYGNANPSDPGLVPPGPYPSQLPPGPYVTQSSSNGPFTSEFDLRSYPSRLTEPTNGGNGGAIPGVLPRFGYEAGAPNYGDAGGRYGADVDERPRPKVRPSSGGRHARHEPPALRRSLIPPLRRPRATPTEEGERQHMPLWQELPLLLVVAFCLAVLIRSFLLQAFFIPSSSMEATLLIGDRVLVNKVIYDLRDPVRGEIVVFRGTDKWAPENYVDTSPGVMSRIGRTLGDLVGVSRPGEKDFIKRVIGLPGDKIMCCDDQGRVVVNGVGIDEPYINANSSLDVPFTPGTCGSRRFDELTIPAGQIFVMGDNRIVSQDARCQGPVPIKNVIGRAFVIIWPSSRWDGLTVPDTFDHVPAAAALGPPSEVDSAPPTPVGAGIITLPMFATLVVSGGTGRKRRWRPRRLRQ